LTAFGGSPIRFFFQAYPHPRAAPRSGLFLSPNAVDMPGSAAAADARPPPRPAGLRLPGPPAFFGAAAYLVNLTLIWSRGKMPRAWEPTAKYEIIFARALRPAPSTKVLIERQGAARRIIPGWHESVVWRSLFRLFPAVCLARRRVPPASAPRAPCSRGQP